jgi:hypothetical protein
MRNLLKLSIIALVLLINSNSYADDFIKAGNRADNDTKVNLLSSDNNRTVVNVEVNGFYNKNVNVENNSYNNVYLEGYTSIGETGAPSLPVITKYIAIPDYKDVRVQIESTVSEEFTSYDVIPYQAPPSRNTNGVNTTFIKDNGAYSLNAYAPSQIVSVKEIAVMRDYRIAVVTIHPVQYNPVEGKLKVYTDIKFSLNYEGYSDVNNVGSTAPKSAVFSNFYKSTIFNYREDASTASPRMLIITNDNLYNGVVPFAAWKNSKGIFTTIIKLTDIGSGPTPTGQQIKDYLVNRYNGNERPDYVLLIGDAAGTNTLSWFTVGIDKSDHPFSCLAGTDIFPDIALGRISVQSLPELTIAMDKLVQYEKQPNMSQTDWYKRAFVLHSFDGIDPVNGQVAKNVFLNEGGFTSVDVLNSNASQSQITGMINGGVSWIWFIGHGDPTSWADPYWSMSNMTSLTFGLKQPQIISTACANADLDYSQTADGFAEAWMERNQQNSASNMAAYTENCAFYTTDTIAREMLYAYFREDINEFGMMMNYGKVQAYNYFNGNSTVKESIHQLLDMGDPSQVTYSDVPKQLTVTTTQSASSSSSFTINVKSGGVNIEQALVGVSQDNVLKVSGYTGADGNYTFDGTAITMGSPLQITVTGRNLIAYQNSVITSIGTTSEIPAEFALQQNYPNPFNPVTNIKFSIPQSSFVTLKVYDLLGKEVASLISSDMNPGVYNFNFDASQLTSGVYFYKLTAGSFTEIKKMSLIK